MDTSKMTEEYRLNYWTNIIHERKQSGKTVEKYCAENGISKDSYYYYQKKVRKAAGNELMKLQGEPSGLVPTGFAEVKLENRSSMSLSSASAQKHICVEIVGMRISASCEYPVEKLTEIIQMAVRSC